MINCSNLRIRFRIHRARKMALTDKDVSKFARNIAAQKMSCIAAEHLGFSFEYLDNLEASCRSNMWKHNAQILRDWKNRKPENNRELRSSCNKSVLYYSQGDTQKLKFKKNICFFIPLYLL